MDLRQKLLNASTEDTVRLLPRKRTMSEKEDETKRRLSLTQRAAYGVGHIMNDVCAAMWFSYTLLFFQVVLGMPPALAGLMLLIGMVTGTMTIMRNEGELIKMKIFLLGQVADAVATPIVGILADRTGGRKTWHMLGE